VTYLYQRNQVQPNSNGLVAHWKLDETTGSTSADTSGSGIAGTWKNTPTYSNAKPAGLAFTDVGGLLFNGTIST
jgi:hypothetical protein